MQGILITPVAGADERLAQLQRRGTPVILVDSRSPSGGQCSVAVDDVLGGDVALSHLLANGHERLAFVGGPLSVVRSQTAVTARSGPCSAPTT